MLPVAQIVEFSGGLRFDTSKPDGTPRKLLDVSCIFAGLGFDEILVREIVRSPQGTVRSG